MTQTWDPLAYAQDGAFVHGLAGASGRADLGRTKKLVSAFILALGIRK